MKFLKAKSFLFNTLKKFKSSDELSKKIYSNVIITLFLRFGSTIISFASVPLILELIKASEYGILLTILSILGWLNLFDFGIGHSLKSILTRKISSKNEEEARSLISTTYFVLFIISIIFNLLFLSKIVDKLFFLFFNKGNSISILRFSFLLISIQFFLQPINTILFSTHKSYISGYINLISSFVILGSYLVLGYLKYNCTWHTILYINLIIPIVSLIISSLYLYGTKYQNLIPKISKIDLKKIKQIYSTGFAFILIQLGVLILFQTDNILILKIIGTEAVSEFNIAYKLFSILTLLFTIIITPFWTGFAEADSKNDLNWIKKKLNRLFLITLFFVFILTPVIYLTSGIIIEMWIGEKVIIHKSTLIAMSIYVASYIYLGYVCYFLNGVNKIKLQAILYVIIAILNIPLCYYFGSKFGLIGIILSNAILMFLMAIILNFQIKSYIKKKYVIH
jgi:O-antigen/teichoic acid export membrane protein